MSVAQRVDVTGIVIGTEAKPISDATVYINGIVTKSSNKGLFTIRKNLETRITVKVNAIGYQAYTDTIAYTGQNLIIQLQANTTNIDEVVVHGQTETLRVKKQAIRAIVVDTKVAADQSVTLTDLINRSAGVRIRQNGGLGNPVDISINGFQGRAIKYFRDGIPLDYLGEGYNVGSLPVEILERIEVYKGVLPIHLGADALGGALNFVTRKHTSGQFLHAYYELGSFNTHRAGLAAHKTGKSEKWQTGIDIFYNYSNNNYKAWVDVTNPETRNTEPTYLPLFHNSFQSIYGEAYFSLLNRSWADELKLTVSTYDQSKDLQHPALFTTAYGAITSGQKAIVPALRYKKSFLDNKMQFDQFLTYSLLNTARVDTLMGRYDWYGNFTPGSTKGETRLPSLSDINELQTTARTNLIYNLSDNDKISLNYVYSHSSRSGNDPYGPRFANSDIDVLTVESTYNKHVLGMSLVNSFFGDKLQHDLMVKYYAFRTQGVQNTWLSADVTLQDQRTQTGTHWGIADALKYQIDPTSMVRGSIEYAYRLPDRQEVFGNNVFIVSNFELNPERSLNINLGYQKTFGNLITEFNTFYRNTKDLIQLEIIQSPNAQYKNQEDVRGYGFDIDLSYKFWDNYRVLTNATWQDLRLTRTLNPKDEGSRLRNTPYFFANVGLQADYQHVFSKEDRLQFFANLNFMKEFYLETISRDLEPQSFLGLFGSAKQNSELIIPNQHLLNFGCTYKIAGSPLTIGAEARNILDKRVFDYYRIPKPGRNYSVKISYHLN